MIELIPIIVIIIMVLSRDEECAFSMDKFIIVIGGIGLFIILLPFMKAFV